MYINIIKYELHAVSYFITSDDVFTPFNPVYANIQGWLKVNNWLDECNHIFTKNDKMLIFNKESVDFYYPDQTAYLQQIKNAFDRIKDKEAKKIINDIYYIFSTDLPAEHVVTIMDHIKTT